MTATVPPSCHPGEGRDSLTNREEAERWNPGFAGMTNHRGDRLSRAAGIRIEDIDLASPLTGPQRETIAAALLAHHVVVFPGQRLSREEQFAFAAQLGEVEEREGKRRGIAHVLSNLDDKGRPRFRMSKAANYHWHTDKPYHAMPPAMTMLYAVELPPAGGDTEFANTALAYEALPEVTKRRIAGLRVTFRPAFDEARPAVTHPLVRTHPATGRKALYLGNHAVGVEGMAEADGMALLAELVAHATQAEFVYRHRWQVSDLVVWDNRCLLHRAAADYDATRYRRVMHRSVIKGSVPV